MFPPGQTAANPIVRVEGASDSLELSTEKDWRGIPWLESDKTRKAVVLLNQRFDLTKGIIIEGHLTAKRIVRGDARPTYAGFYIEGAAEKNSGTAVLLEVGEQQWRESRIGGLHTDLGFHFEPLDLTGRASATVTGIDDGKDHTFRLWLRGGQMELYIDDLLMQSFFYFRATGRIGFLAQESDVVFSQLRFYGMNL